MAIGKSIEISLQLLAPVAVFDRIPEGEVELIGGCFGCCI